MQIFYSKKLSTTSDGWLSLSYIIYLDCNSFGSSYCSSDLNFLGNCDEWLDSFSWFSLLSMWTHLTCLLSWCRWLESCSALPYQQCRQPGPCLLLTASAHLYKEQHFQTSQVFSRCQISIVESETSLHFPDQVTYQHSLSSQK